MTHRHKSKKVWPDHVKQWLIDNIRADFTTGKLYWRNHLGYGRNAGDECGKGIVKTTQGKQYHFLSVPYALNNKKALSLKVHHVIWFLKYGKQPDHVIDHLDGNSLNNILEPPELCNLQDVPQRVNCINSRKSRRKNAASRFKGVTRSNDKFRAMIREGGGSICTMTRPTQEAAARDYDLASIVLHGDQNRFRNFPDSDYSPEEIDAMQRYLAPKIDRLKAKVLH